MNSEGFVVLSRKIDSWRYADCPYVFALWIRILLMANWKDGWFKGTPVKRGECITSVRHLADKTGMTPKTIRTCLKKLQDNGEISVEATHQWTHIKVLNYEVYQGCDENMGTADNTVSNTPSSTPSNHNRTRITKKQGNNKHIYGEYKHVQLTDDEFTKLHYDFPNADALIQYLDEYIEMKGYKAKSHYLAIRKWVVDAVAKNNKPSYKPRKVDVLPEYMTAHQDDEIPF